ncbi:hypothetical protein ACSER0_25400 [Pseudomonas aeruginosa]
MSSTQHQLIKQCATRLRGIVEALDNIHDTSPHRWSTDLDEVHSSAESLLALINDQAPTQDAQGLAGTALRDSPASVEQAGVDERAAFERAFTVQEGIYFDDKRGEYRSMNLRAIEATDAQDLNLRLQGWQARAALAQPSAALPPFAEKVLAKLRRFYDCASDFESGGVDIGRHWLDLLTQLGLLNRVQRSPALWEISQQGEDLLEAPVAQAQHSVPEEFIGRLSEFLAQRGTTGKALLRELRAMLAAAPARRGCDE